MSNEIACIKVTVIYLKGQTLLELKGKKCLRMFLNNEILNVTTKKQVDCLFTYNNFFFVQAMIKAGEKLPLLRFQLQITNAKHKLALQMKYIALVKCVYLSSNVNRLFFSLLLSMPSVQLTELYLGHLKAIQMYCGLPDSEINGYLDL